MDKLVYSSFDENGIFNGELHFRNMCREWQIEDTKIADEEFLKIVDSIILI